MNIDTEKLQKLLSILKEKGVAEFEHEDKDVKLRVAWGTAKTELASSTSAHAASVAVAASPNPAADASIVEVTSPFVGTFYRAPSPEAAPFVDVGSVIRPGQTLCIVEAMKLMNEIESEVGGTIVEIMGQNGKSVEFGQKLFRIKKA